jgi:hypothetical protein
LEEAVQARQQQEKLVNLTPARTLSNISQLRRYDKS